MANFVFQDNSNQVFRQINKNCDATMEKIGDLLVESVQKAMLYRYSREPIDTGALFDSITAEQRRVSQNTWETTVGSSKHYAGYVHEGTYKMKGRPYIRDGVMDAQDDVQNLMANGLSQGFK